MSNESAAEATAQQSAEVDPIEKVGLGLYHGQPRHEVVDRIPRGTRRLLDVGCANGAFGMTVKERLGAEVWGIEIHEPAARVAQKRLDRVLIGDALASMATMPEGHFDCVTFNDVLEHLVDPEALLRETKKHLAPGGVVIASIPNVRHWEVLYNLVWKGNFDYADWGVLDRTHLRFFTIRSIAKLFDAAGYQLRAADGINGPQTARGQRMARWLPKSLADVQWLQFLCTAVPR